MRKVGILAGLVVLFSFPALAQEGSRVEVFGGYSFIRPGSLFEESSLRHGWDASLTIPVRKWLGITSDFSGFYKSFEVEFPPPSLATSETTYHSFLFGPQLALRRHPRITPFAQLLVGVGYHTLRNYTPGPLPGAPSGTFAKYSDTAFAAVGGGGIDLKLTSKFSYRFIQADYFNDGSYLGYRNNFRFATGIIFRFGRR